MSQQIVPSNAAATGNATSANQVIGNSYLSTLAANSLPIGATSILNSTSVALNAGYDLLLVKN